MPIKLTSENFSSADRADQKQMLIHYVKAFRGGTVFLVFWKCLHVCSHVFCMQMLIYCVKAFCDGDIFCLFRGQFCVLAHLFL